MHDTPRPLEENTIPDDAPLANLIAELAAADPAEGPDIADQIAVRLEADLAPESGRARPAEAAPEAS
jgi:hypothetical protein